MKRGLGEKSGIGDNPWGLTNAEAEVMDAMITTGTRKVASRQLGISPKTLEARSHRASIRMGYSGQDVRRYIEWDRWRRSEASAQDGEAPEAQRASQGADANGTIKATT
jgi:hypothetical protein